MNISISFKSIKCSRAETTAFKSKRLSFDHEVIGGSRYSVDTNVGYMIHKEVTGVVVCGVLCFVIYCVIIRE